MNRIAAGLSIPLVIATWALLVNPAAAQSRGPASAPVGCTGDYVCSGDPSVIATWPLERWTTVRRSGRQTAARSGAGGRNPRFDKQ